MEKQNNAVAGAISQYEEMDDQYDSEEQRIDEQARLKRRQQRRRKEQQNKNQIQETMIVGTGFGFNITDHFDFGKTEDCLPEISGSHFAWMIVLYAVCNSAMVPPWIMNIKANKYNRICWRFMMQSIMMIPFVLYEYRTGNEDVKRKYKLSYILQKENLRSIYITSLSTAFWFTVILTCFDWSYISHALVLGTLSNLFLSLSNIFRPKANGKGGHQMEIGGHLLALIGIMLVMGDSYSLDTQLQPSDCKHLINPLYLGRNKWHRVISNITALFVSFIQSLVSRKNRDPKSYLPSYLSVMISNIGVSINMALSAYFFNGSSFDMHPVYGIFSIFSEKHFTGFLYMSIILGLGLFLSSVMITKIFDQKLTPTLAMQFDPIICTMFLRLAGVQCMPGTIAALGYVFIIPGMFLINFGQNELDKKIQAQQLKKKLQSQNIQLRQKNRELTQSLLTQAIKVFAPP